MSIIAILAGLGARGYHLAKRKAKESRAKADIESFATHSTNTALNLGPTPNQMPK